MIPDRELDKIIETDIDIAIEMKYRNDLCPYCKWPTESIKHLDSCGELCECD